MGLHEQGFNYGLAKALRSTNARWSDKKQPGKKRIIEVEDIGGGRRPDILIDDRTMAKVVIECEIEGGKDKDAPARLKEDGKIAGRPSPSGCAGSTAIGERMRSPTICSQAQSCFTQSITGGPCFSTNRRNDNDQKRAILAQPIQPKEQPIMAVRNFRATIKNDNMQRPLEVVVQARNSSDARELIKGQYGPSVKFMSGPTEGGHTPATA